jgi:hypothetical protein
MSTRQTSRSRQTDPEMQAKLEAGAQAANPVPVLPVDASGRLLAPIEELADLWTPENGFDRTLFLEMLAPSLRFHAHGLLYRTVATEPALPAPDLLWPTQLERVRDVYAYYLACTTGGQLAFAHVWYRVLEAGEREALYRYIGATLPKPASPANLAARAATPATPDRTDRPKAVAKAVPVRREPVATSTALW